MEIHSNVYMRLTKLLDLPEDEEVPCDSVPEGRWKGYAWKSVWNYFARLSESQPGPLPPPKPSRERVFDCPGAEPFERQEQDAIWRILTARGPGTSRALTVACDALCEKLRAAVGDGSKAYVRECIVACWSEWLRRADAVDDLFCMFARMICPASGGKARSALEDFEFIASEHCQGTIKGPTWGSDVSRFRLSVRALLT